MASNRFQENDEVVVTSEYGGGRYQGQAGVVTEVHPWPEGEVNQVKLHDGSLWFSDAELDARNPQSR